MVVDEWDDARRGCVFDGVGRGVILRLLHIIIRLLHIASICLLRIIIHLLHIIRLLRIVLLSIGSLLLVFRFDEIALEETILAIIVIHTLVMMKAIHPAPIDTRCNRRTSCGRGGDQSG